VVLCPLSVHAVLKAPANEASQTRVVQPALSDLAQAIHELEREMAADSPTTRPAPAVPQRAEPVVLPVSLKPWSMQFRTVSVTVHFSTLAVSHQDGPTTYYTQGFFADPEDGRVYHFLFNDMGAMAASREESVECVVVFRPYDRQLTESDIAAIIPVDWVKKTSEMQQQRDQGAALLTGPLAE
jgi:hypothetical protein